MRKLHYVKHGTDGELAGHLVLETADGNEQFLLDVDLPLRDAVRPQPSTGTQRADAPTPIAPREIQVRVRAGESAEHLAETHGASLDWIMRFAFPVLAERERIADEARRARARRSTTDGQPVVFGTAVDARFAAHGVDATSVRWDARRREDGQWLVSAHWSGGEAWIGTASEHHAEWSFQLAARTVAPLDDTAADLLSDSPIRAPQPAPVETSLTLSSAPPLARGVVAFPDLDLADAHTGRLPIIEDELFDQDAFAAARDSSGARNSGDVADAPAAEPLPLPIEAKPRSTRRRSARVTNLGVAGHDEPARDRSGRQPVPSWDDILLGVRRKND